MGPFCDKSLLEVASERGWYGSREAQVPVGPGADRIFHVAFFIVVANVLVPGATVT